MMRIEDLMRHAYLIIAHNEPRLLQLLVTSLDDERNDIYIHIDKKSCMDINFLQVKKAGLYILNDRIDGRWGDFSLVEIELSLFKAALNNQPYSFYHLLSGVDLPIKSQDYIHEFCDLHSNNQFIGFSEDVNGERKLYEKIGLYHIFTKDLRNDPFSLKTLRFLFKKLQLLLNIHRVDDSIVLKRGSQWCSLTHDFVKYVLNNESKIYKMYKYTICPDESFIQTVCWNSPFKQQIYNTTDEFEGCMRFIKWKDGNLQSIDLDDLDLMKASKLWFARKFTFEDTNVINKYKDLFKPCKK